MSEERRRETLTVEEAAALLGIGRATAYHLAKNGRIGPVPVLRFGRRLLIPRAALERVLAGEFEVDLQEGKNDENSRCTS